MLESEDRLKIYAPGLRRYFEQRIRGGSFLDSLLACELATAIKAASDGGAIPSLVWWLEEYAPGHAWGSRARVEAWIAGAS